MNTRDPVSDGSNVSPSYNLGKHVKKQQHKKVRRRLHNERPYQERHINMAQVRREIVTALKSHRAAAMKQASEQQHQQKHQQEQLQPRPSITSFHRSTLSRVAPDVRFKFKRNPRMSPSLSKPPLPVQKTYTSFSPSLVVENPNYIIPNDILGLNQNIHDFNISDTAFLLNNHHNNSSNTTLDTAHLLNNHNKINSSNNLEPTFLFNNYKNNSSSLYSYSSPISVFPPLSFLMEQEIPSIATSQEGVSSMDTIESSVTTKVNLGSYHIEIDDEGIEEMRSLGEQYQMEWNDTMNLVSSALWSNLLENMDSDAQEVNTNEYEAVYRGVDTSDEFPDWLNVNEKLFI